MRCRLKYEKGAYMWIIATIGMNVDSYEKTAWLAQAGMNVIRLNFSHPHHSLFEDVCTKARQSLPGVKIMQDLQGLKLRVADAYLGEEKINAGDMVRFCSEDAYQSILRKYPQTMVIPLNVRDCFKRFSKASIIYLKDATMEFNVLTRMADHLLCETVKGGMIRAQKSINIPDFDRRGMGLTEKDYIDLDFAIQHKVDIIGLSYVEGPDIIHMLKDFLRNQKTDDDYNPVIWAKIETMEGVKKLARILPEVDGIILGRGDLGPEAGLLEIPRIQEKVLKRMRREKDSKDMIIATQVLETMRFQPQPSRTELNDIYNSINLGANGFMLGSEISLGKYPKETIEALQKAVIYYSNS